MCVYICWRVCISHGFAVSSNFGISYLAHIHFEMMALHFIHFDFRLPFSSWTWNSFVWFVSTALLLSSWRMHGFKKKLNFLSVRTSSRHQNKCNSSRMGQNKECKWQKKRNEKLRSELKKLNSCFIILYEIDSYQYYLYGYMNMNMEWNDD